MARIEGMKAIAKLIEDVTKLPFSDERAFKAARPGRRNRLPANKSGSQRWWAHPHEVRAWARQWLTDGVSSLSNISSVSRRSR